jgi:hypothetical protein
VSDLRRLYWCPSCEVFGLGRYCWVCGSPELSRTGAELDKLERWIEDESFVEAAVLL